MALTNCPECNNEVSDSALTCPHCGFQLKNQKLQKKAPKKKAGGCAIIIIAILILFIVFHNIGSNDESDDSRGTSKMLAYNYAENFVKKKLKSPSTADFPGVQQKDQHTTMIGKDKYKIESWVDSENSFGANIRTKFSCIIIFEGDQVRCEQLRFEK